MDPNLGAEQEHLDKEAAIVFPPPISWGKAYGASGRCDMFAYIALNSVIVAEIERKGDSCQEEQWPSFRMISQQGGFTCVNLSQQDYDHFPIKDSPVVTGDSEGWVRIWNLRTRKCVTKHNSHANNTTSVTCVEWSPRDPNRVFSTDSEGGVAIWNVKENSLKKMKLDSVSHLSCLAVSPFEDHVIAIGTLPGNILIVDTSEGEMITRHKMHHDEDLVKLSWVPSESFSVELETHHETPLLVSSVYTIKEPNIRVWDRRGQEVCVLNLTETKEEISAAQVTPGRTRVQKNFVPVAWVKNPLSGGWNLFSSLKNNVVCWGESDFELVHDIHNVGVIFCLIQTGDYLWSFGLESVIVGWNLRLGQPLVVVPTVKGICAVHASPVDGTQVTLGGADGILRVLSMREGYPVRGAHQLPTLTSRIDAKITAVCWHPHRDNLIALGTHDGILGIYEYRDQNRFVRRFERRAPGTVYSLDWGPRSYSKDFEMKSLEEGNTLQNHLQLYICTGDKLFSLNPNPKNLNAALVNISTIIRKSNPVEEGRSSFKVTDLRWSPDHTFLCIGYHDGRINLHYPPYLNLRVSIRCHNKAIQHLLWRSYDFGPDSLSKWLASASNDGKIRLYNLAAVFSNPNANKEDMLSSAVTLNGHGTVRVISLAWSPHDPKLLLSVSYDLSAIVWNILDPDTPVARYFGHSQRLVACLFHPSHPFLVLSCSDELSSDFPMHIWDFRNHPYREDPRIVTNYNNRVQTIKCQRVEKEQEPMRLDKFVKADSGVIVPGSETEKQAQEEIGDLNHLKPFHNDVIPLTRARVENFVEFYLDSLDDFGKVLGLGKVDSSKIDLEPEIAAHKEASSWNHAVELSLWTGNHTELVRDALIREEIGSEVVLVVLTQSYEPSFRTQVVESYAKRLIAQGDISTAVTYLLLIGRDMEAIDAYLHRKMFQESLLLAKSRLRGPLEKAISDKILNLWTSHLLELHNYPQAYRLFCAAGEYTSALGVLEAWNTPQAYQLALVLATKIENQVDAQSYGAKTIQHLLLQDNYSKSLELVTEFPFLKWALAFILTNQILSEDLRAQPEAIVTAWNVQGIEKQDFPEIRANLTNYLKLAIPQSRKEALLVISKCIVYTLLDSPSQIPNLDFGLHEWFEEHELATFRSVLSSDQDESSPAIER